MKNVKVGDIICKQWLGQNAKKVFWHAIVLNVKQKTFSFLIYFSNYYKGKRKYFEWHKNSLSDMDILNRQRK